MLLAAGAKASQFRAVVKEAQTLSVGPSEKYPLLTTQVVQGEAVLVLGNSTGGVWMNIMKSDGREGWIPATKVDLYKVPPYELDDLEEAWQRKRRVTSNWVIDAGTILASGPNAIGASATVWWVPFSNGLTAKKIDQLEFGAGFRYAVRVATKSSLNGKGFSEMPFMMQWMFRMPPRGSLMAGVKAGATLLQDTAGLNSSFYAFVWGASIRYFPFDNFGFFVDLVTAHRLNFFITREMGMSFRF
jgi:hypothetical protein